MPNERFCSGGGAQLNKFTTGFGRGIHQFKINFIVNLRQSVFFILNIVWVKRLGNMTNRIRKYRSPSRFFFDTHAIPIHADF